MLQKRRHLLYALTYSTRLIRVFTINKILSILSFRSTALIEMTFTLCISTRRFRERLHEMWSLFFPFTEDLTYDFCFQPLS